MQSQMSFPQDSTMGEGMAKLCGLCGLTLALFVAILATYAFAETPCENLLLVPTDKSSPNETTGAEDLGDAVFARQLNGNERMIVSKIKQRLDRVGILEHQIAGTWLLWKYPADLLVRATVEYLRHDGFMRDGRGAAAYILARTAWKLWGDETALIYLLLQSEDPDIRRAANERIRLRLGGVKGFLRGLLRSGAPKAFQSLDPATKTAVVHFILRDTGMGMRATTAGLIESLGSPPEMRDIAETQAFTREAHGAADRVGRDRGSSLINKWALLMTALPIPF